MQGLQVRVPGECGYRELQGRIPLALLREQVAAAEGTRVWTNRSMGATGFRRTVAGQLLQSRRGFAAPAPLGVGADVAKTNPSIGGGQFPSLGAHAGPRDLPEGAGGGLDTCGRWTRGDSLGGYI